MLGQQAWDHCWTAKQHLATRLAKRGHRVLYIDPDWEPWNAPEGAGPTGLREIGPRSLWVYRHPYAAALGYRWNQRACERAVRRLLVRLHLPEAIGLLLTPQAGELARRLPLAARVYYAVDEWTAFGGLGEATQDELRAAEERVLAECDLALGVSPRLVTRFRDLQPRTYLLENAADYAHFSAARRPEIEVHAAVDALPRPRVGFVGQLDERICQDLVIELARARRAWSFVFVGRAKPGVDFARLDAEPNVHRAGYVAYDDLPSVLAGFDVGIVPYRSSELTQSCCPLKVYEYLAAGLPVVSTPLEGLGSAAAAVRQVDSALEAVAAIEEVLAAPADNLPWRMAVARRASWDERADELEARLREALGVARGEEGPRPLRRALSVRAATRLPDPVTRLTDYGELQTEPAFHRPALRGAFELLRALGHVCGAWRAARRLAAGRSAHGIERLLVVRQEQIGDLLTLVPALETLRERSPATHIVLGVPRRGAASGLLVDAGLVDEVRELDALAATTATAKARALVALFAEGFDAVLSGMGYFTRPEAFLTGAQWRVGAWDGHARQRLNQRVLPSDPDLHEAQSNLALVELLLGTPTDLWRTPRLVHDTERAARAAEAMLEQLGVPRDAPLLVLHPGSVKATRRWPAERHAAVVESALEAHPELQLVITGVANEREVAREVLAQLTEASRARAFDATGKSDLTTLVGLVTRARLVLSNDTGVAHLARTLGAPLVAVLGPENDRRWGPHPRGAAPAVALRKEVPCAPCNRAECAALYCLSALGVDEVAREVLRMLDGKSSSDTRLVTHRETLSWADLMEFALLLAALTEREREVLMRFHAGGESVALIAASLALPEGTIKSHLHRARKKLVQRAEENDE